MRTLVLLAVLVLGCAPDRRPVGAGSEGDFEIEADAGQRADSAADFAPPDSSLDTDNACRSRELPLAACFYCRPVWATSDDGVEQQFEIPSPCLGSLFMGPDDTIFCICAGETTMLPCGHAEHCATPPLGVPCRWVEPVDSCQPPPV